MNTPREDLQSMMNDAPLPTITVKPRTVYGQVKYYPMCGKAAIFATMLGQTTLTVQDLKQIMALGFELIYEQDSHEVKL